MDLIYILLILLSFGNQLPPIQPLGRFLLLNYQTSRFTINILPRDFHSSEIHKNLQKLHNNSTVVEETPSEPNELDGQPKVQEEFAKTAVEEVEDWFPELYPYIPACNKEGKCTAVILKFSPEQLQKDNGKTFDYLFHQEIGQSKAVSHVEEAINSQGEKLIIATIDEETILNEFYSNLAENKKTVLQIACGVGVFFGILLAFFGRKVLNALLFVGGFSVTALIVNFWEYPGKINATNVGHQDFYQNLTLIVGAGLSAGIFAVKAQKILLGLLLASIGVGAGAFFWYFVLNQNETLILIFFSVIVAGLLFSLGEFLLKNYNEVSALSTTLFGASFFGLSILAYLSVDITKQGFDINSEDLGARKMMLIFWVSFFLLIYGVKFQLGIKGRRERKAQGKAVAGAKTAAAGGVQSAATASAGGVKKQELPEKLKNMKPNTMKAGKRKGK